jgi:glycosyltransferase involved in cell wall biosynthesis
MLVMTKELEKYYLSLKVNEIFHLPMTVEVERFNDTIDSSKLDNYFLYIGGSGGFNRDGIKNIINGYNYFSKKYPNIKLFIIGPLNKTSPLFVEIDNYIKNKKITEGVVFKGPISSSEIPKYLKKAIGIIMAPQNNFTSGGFPTKLGEFLASGRPVIITNVSEISSYLNNNNSFLIEPGNDFLISEAMEKIISNEEFANKIGNEGQKIAEFHFNVQTYKSNLIEFLKI